MNGLDRINLPGQCNSSLLKRKTILHHCILLRDIPWQSICGRTAYPEHHRLRRELIKIIDQQFMHLPDICQTIGGIGHTFARSLKAIHAVIQGKQRLSMLRQSDCRVPETTTNLQDAIGPHTTTKPVISPLLFKIRCFCRPSIQGIDKRFFKCGGFTRRWLLTHAEPATKIPFALRHKPSTSSPKP